MIVNPIATSNSKYKGLFPADKPVVKQGVADTKPSIPYAKFNAVDPQNISVASWMPITPVDLSKPRSVSTIPSVDTEVSSLQNTRAATIQLSISSLADSKNNFLGGCYVYLLPGVDRIDYSSKNGAFNFNVKVGDANSYDDLTGANLAVQINVAKSDTDPHPVTYRAEIDKLPSIKDGDNTNYSLKLSDFIRYGQNATTGQWEYGNQKLSDALVADKTLETTGFSFMLSADTLPVNKGTLTFSDTVFTDNNPESHITFPAQDSFFSTSNASIHLRAVLNQPSTKATFLLYQIDPADQKMKLVLTIPANVAVESRMIQSSSGITGLVGGLAAADITNPVLDVGNVYIRLAVTQPDGTTYLSPTTTRIGYTNTGEFSGTVPVSLGHISGQTDATANWIFADKEGSVAKAIGQFTDTVQLTYSWTNEQDFPFAGILLDPDQSLNYRFLSNNVHLEFEMENSEDLSGGKESVQLGIRTSDGKVYQFGADLSKVHNASNKYSIPLNHFAYNGYSEGDVYVPADPSDNRTINDVQSENEGSYYSQIIFSPKPTQPVTDDVLSISNLSFTTESKSVEFDDQSQEPIILTETDTLRVGVTSQNASAPYTLEICNSANSCYEMPIDEKELIVPPPRRVGQYKLYAAGMTDGQKIWTDKNMDVSITSPYQLLQNPVGVTFSDLVPVGDVKIVDGSDANLSVFAFGGDEGEDAVAVVANKFMVENNEYTGLYSILQDKPVYNYATQQNEYNGYAGGVGVSFPKDQWYQYRAAFGELVVTGDSLLWSGDAPPIKTGTFVVTVESATNTFEPIKLEAISPITWPKTNIPLNLFSSSVNDSIESLMKDHKDAYISSVSVVPLELKSTAQYLLKIDRIELTP